MMNPYKIDILAFGIHPDDVELSCSGTLAKHIALGKKVAICDLTQGELGTRGNAVLRLEEAENAKNIVGVSFRENLKMEDIWAENSQSNILIMIEIIRKYQPEIVLCNAKEDRHPDHQKGYEMAQRACFASGLPKIETKFENKTQQAWRPKAVYSYIQSNFLDPDFVVDITEYMDKKLEAISAFKSQFFNPEMDEPNTFISDKSFLDMIKSQNLIFGKAIGVQYAEGFHTARYMGVDNLFYLI
jgi:bacillithiol biosynthesis deacetylase BshB1